MGSILWELELTHLGLEHRISGIWADLNRVMGYILNLKIEDIK